MRFWTGKMLPNAVVFPLPTKLRGVCLIDGGFLDMLMGVLWTLTYLMLRCHTMIVDLHLCPVLPACSVVPARWHKLRFPLFKLGEQMGGDLWKYLRDIRLFIGI